MRHVLDSPRTTRWIIFGLGLASLLPYLVAWQLGDLRQHTVGFEIAFFTAFALYAGATVLALRLESFSRRDLALVFGLAIIFQAFLTFTPPTLSDDMYRYVWDGRVQAQGISPYRYSPKAPELAYLRDETVWKFINRKAVVTVYPPGAEMAYALLWRIWPDSIRWFQIAMGLGGLLAGGLLVGLLRSLGRSSARVLIYLWSPLLAFETAHAAHVDGLVLPLLVGAWWARIRERDSLVGLLLGLATSLKFYPALLLPALWRPRHPAGRWRMPLTFAITVLGCYLPYIITSGRQVLGYLPNYLQEQFNLGLAELLIPLLTWLGFNPRQGPLWLMLCVLAVIGLWLVIRPAADGETAVRRCVWLIGAFAVLTHNLFPWYLLWLLPLLALFLSPDHLSGLRADAWTGWWLFCGSVTLSYTFFIHWRVLPLAQWAQFLPPYPFLLIDLARRLKNYRFGALF
jgi:alpha-1,6-mannosyltransferase